MANMDDGEKFGSSNVNTTKSDSGSKTALYVIIAFGIGLVVALVGSLFCALKIIDKQEEITVNELTPDFLNVSKGKQKKVEIEGKNDADVLDENEVSYGAFFPIDNFVVNLVDDGFLKIQIFVEFTSRDVPPSFLAKLVPAKDSIIDILSGRKAAELKTVNGKDLLRNDIKDLLNTLLGKERQLVRDVYFTTYLIKE